MGAKDSSVLGADGRGLLGAALGACARCCSRRRRCIRFGAFALALSALLAFASARGASTRALASSRRRAIDRFDARALPQFVGAIGDNLLTGGEAVRDRGQFAVDRAGLHWAYGDCVVVLYDVDESTGCATLDRGRRYRDGALL